MLTITVGAKRWRAALWLVVVPAVSGALLVAGAGEATAAWQSLGDLGPSGVVMQEPSTPIAIAPNGRSVFVWQDNLTVYARSVKPDGTLDWLRTVSDDAAQPIVAVDGQGTATVLWRGWSSSRFKTRTISPGGDMSAVQPVSTPDVIPATAELKVTPSGYALFSWLADRRTGDLEVIQARSRSNGVLGPVQNIARYRNPNGQVLSGRMALRPNGDAVFAWWRFGDSIRSRRRTADGTLGPPRTVASYNVGNGRFGLDVAVGLDPAGAATVAFTANDCRSSSSCFGRVLARTEDRPIVNVSPVGQDAFRPQLAMDGHGGALFMWQTSEALRARGRSADGAFGSVQTIAGRSTTSPSMAVNSGGAAVFGWMHVIEFGMFDEPDTARPRVRTRSAGGALGPSKALSDPVTERYPRVAVAINAGGRAAAMYNAGDVERGALGP